MKYSVEYEYETKPQNVLIEIKCKDEQEAIDLYEQRRDNPSCLNVKILKE